MIRRLVLSLALALAATGPASARTKSDVTISAEIREGGPVWFSWSITPTGEATYTERVTPPGAHYEFPVDYWFVTRRVQAGVAGYREIAALIAPAVALRARDWKCDFLGPDTPDGWVRLGNGPGAKSMSYHVCRSRGSQTLGKGIDGARRRFVAWTKDQVPVQRKWMGTGPEPAVDGGKS